MLACLLDKFLVLCAFLPHFVIPLGLYLKLSNKQYISYFLFRHKGTDNIFITHIFIDFFLNFSYF